MKRILLALFLAVLLVISSVGVISANAGAPPSKKLSDIAKVVFIHYRAPAKPDKAAKPPKSLEGYSLFQGGVRWFDSSLPVHYSINLNSVPSNVNKSSAANEISAAFEMWDANTSKELFYDTLGITTKTGAIFDEKNVISWTSMNNPGIIAMNSYWYYRSTKELIESDIEFNSDFEWGIDRDGEGTVYALDGAMDIRNIATHEIGHALVLSDLYQTQYSQMTMYGYSDYEEVYKISLEAGDIAGLQRLYGQ